MPNTRLSYRLLDGLIAIFGFWTVYSHIQVYTGGSFNDMILFSALPVFGAILFLVLMRDTGDTVSQSTSSAKRSYIPWYIKVVAAAVIVAIYYLTQNFYLFWGLGVALLLVNLIDHTRHTTTPTETSGNKEFIGVGLLIVAAVAITLVAHRSDIDDVLYLNLAVQSMDFPSLPLLASDGMYGEKDLPMLGVYYRAHSYQLIVAVVAYLTSVPKEFYYYILFPAVLAAFVIIAHWALLKQIRIKQPIIALMFIFLVMIAWGDLHLSYGNFSFVRLFQGKAIVASVLIPAIIFYALRYSQNPGIRNGVLLALAQISAVGFSSSALVLAPAAAALVLFANWRPSRQQTKTLFLGLCTSSYIVGLALIVQYEQTLANAAAVGGMQPKLLSTLSLKPVTETKEVLDFMVFGEGWRSYIALFALLSASAFPASTVTHRFISGFTLICALLVLNPFTPNWLADHIAGPLNYRIFWVVPMPLILGLLIVQVCSANTNTRGIWLGRVIGAAVVALFLLAPGKWTLSEENFTELKAPGYKVDQLYAVAEKIVQLTPQDGLVLAPYYISNWIPTFHQHPRTIAVRKLGGYHQIIAKAKGTEEANRRIGMVHFIEGSKGTHVLYPIVMGEIMKRKVSTVVLPPKNPWRKQFGQQLQNIGYVSQEVGPFDVWIAPATRE